MGLRTRTIAAQVANSFSNAAAAQPLTLTSNVTFEKVSANTVNANDFTISGNLTVTGTTTYVNSTNLNIGDNIITLNADIGSNAPTENAGMEIHRGTSANVAIRWNETSDIWQSTIDGTNYLTLATNNDVSTAYSNAITYSGNAALAYSNAVTTAASDATTKAATAYSNATSYADTRAATAYSNAVAYAAANTYVNTQLGLKADLSGATFSGAISGITTLATGNTTVTGFANVSGTLQVGANVVLGTTTITANGGVGTAGQVLTSGATGNVYWSTVATTLDAVLGIGNTTTKSLTTGPLTVNGAIRTTTAFIENATAVTANYTITANTNAMTAGPITIANTATVTIPSDSNWIIL